ncbi:MAG: hypothetical protein CSA70_09695 [Rhodobacterales bacterium]|nr:MAG: hypothetical protein CSA70_09695 [Rhodobacterales bacterium]
MTLWKALAAVAMLSLAACGNDTERDNARKAVFSGLLGMVNKSEPNVPSAQQLAAQASAALKNSDLPLTVTVIENTKVGAVLTRIETNGDYGTWASGDRRFVTLKHGIVTGSRGLGNDLMSADVEAVSALIRARKPGTATRVHRYLNGQNLTVELRATCSVTVGKKSRVTGATINSMTTRVIETCIAGETRFENSYQVDSRGYALLSRQWLGDVNGYFQFQTLRL